MDWQDCAFAIVPPRPLKRCIIAKSTLLMGGRVFLPLCWLGRRTRSISRLFIDLAKDCNCWFNRQFAHEKYEWPICCNFDPVCAPCMRKQQSPPMQRAGLKVHVCIPVYEPIDIENQNCAPQTWTFCNKHHLINKLLPNVFYYYRHKFCFLECQHSMVRAFTVQLKPYSSIQCITQRF